MIQVTLTFGGKSQTVDRAIVESQLRKAEQASSDVRGKLAAVMADSRISAAEKTAATQRANADIARYESIADACRAALA